MEMDRRKFLSVTSAAGVGLLASMPTRNLHAGLEAGKEAYKYRLAFDVWINDVRNEAMPLENWPYGVLDDKTVDGIIRALDVQREAGYNVVDLIGLWATYVWPVDISSVVDKDRQRRVNEIIKAVHEREMKLICFPSGILNWGFDEIIKHDPVVRTDNKHEMNPLREESWQWQYKVFDFVTDNYDIDGFHLESADQGRCSTKECMERWPNQVAYHTFVTGQMADYIRRKHPGMMVIATVQGFKPWGQGFTEEEKAHVVELSKRVDCLFDQGHGGTFIPQTEWREFIPRLHCAYGTSGGLWVYPPQRWERTRWFLPYTIRTGRHIKDLYDAGGRGVMYYQGPVINPSTEVNIAFGGRIMTNVGESIEDVLAETLESLYRPKNAAAHRKLVEIFQRAENTYFEQWNIERIKQQQYNKGIREAGDSAEWSSGELHLTYVPGASPGPATYLMHPFLDTDGRFAYKQALVSIYKEVSEIDHAFEDNGRIDRIKQGIRGALVDINNIARAKGENKVWDDRNVGLRF